MEVKDLHDVQTVAEARDLIDQQSNPSEYVLKCDSKGRTALHTAKNSEIAKLLIENADDKSAYVNMTDSDGRTALHTAGNSYKFSGATKIMEVLIDNAEDKPAYVRATDYLGRTALHKAECGEIAKLLIEKSENKSEYVNMTDCKGKTALHTAIASDGLFQDKDDKVAEELIAGASDKSGYVAATDKLGRTALHYAMNKSQVQLLLKHASNKLGYINSTDNQQETAMMTMIYHARLRKRVPERKELVSFLLQIIYDEFGPAEFANSLSMINADRRNIVHFLCASYYGFNCPFIIANLIKRVYEFGLYDILARVLERDKYGNTPLHYLIARYNTAMVYDLCMLIPLWKRREILTQKRKDGLTCQSILGEDTHAIAHYMRDVFKGTKDLAYVGRRHSYSPTRKDYYTFLQREPPPDLRRVSIDENLFAVMKCVLNEYPVFYAQLFLSRSRLIKQPPVWCFLDVMDPNRPWKEQQSELYRIDSVENQGIQKVVVVTGYSSKPTKYLSPPGPDCIIISVIGTIPPRKLEILKHSQQTDITDFLGELANTTGVEYINVNSTLRSHFGSSTKRNKDFVFINNKCRGKALIICTASDRNSWSEEWTHAQHVFEQQLGLEVVIAYDLSTEEMKEEIQEFAKSYSSNSLVALAVMSHGDTMGNICDKERNIIAVQDVVDAFCPTSTPLNVTKVMCFSFCRGPLGRNPGNKKRISRAPESTKYKLLEEISSIEPFETVKEGVSSAMMEKVKERHAFPSVEVPEGCYILYSTLPDSKSFRRSKSTGEINKMFQELRGYLAELPQSYTQTPEPSIRPPEAAKGHKSSKDKAKLEVPFAEVELLTLFVDVAGRVERESRATQDLNFCYRLDRKSKTVHVKVYLEPKQ